MKCFSRVNIIVAAVTFTTVRFTAQPTGSHKYCQAADAFKNSAWGLPAHNLPSCFVRRGLQAY